MIASVKAALSGALYGALGGLAITVGIQTFDRFTGSRSTDEHARHLKYRNRGKEFSASHISASFDSKVDEAVFSIWRHARDHASRNLVVKLLEEFARMLSDSRSSGIASESVVADATHLAMRIDANMRIITYHLKDSSNFEAFENVEEHSKVLHVEIEEGVNELRNLAKFSSPELRG